MNEALKTFNSTTRAPYGSKKKARRNLTALNFRRIAAGTKDIGATMILCATAVILIRASIESFKN